MNLEMYYPEHVPEVDYVKLRYPNSTGTGYEDIIVQVKLAHRSKFPHYQSEYFNLMAETNFLDVEIDTAEIIDLNQNVALYCYMSPRIVEAWAYRNLPGGSEVVFKASFTDNELRLNKTLYVESNLEEEKIFYNLHLEREQAHFYDVVAFPGFLTQNSMINTISLYKLAALPSSERQGVFASSITGGCYFLGELGGSTDTFGTTIDTEKLLRQEFPVGGKTPVEEPNAITIDTGN